MLCSIPWTGCGGSGPASTIFCFPIFPHRGCSVASSVSVAKRVEQIAWPDRVLERRRVVAMKRVFHRIEVIEVAEEFVEAVQRWQVGVAIS